MKKDVVTNLVMAIGLVVVFIGMIVGTFVSTTIGIPVVEIGFGISFLGLLIVSLVEGMISEKKRAES